MDNEIILKEMNGEVLANSREIAERFGKQHKHVLDKISQLEIEIQPAENSARYFTPSEYADLKGELRKEYLLTRDGFSLVVMGFTGTKALEWKLKYIEAFNKLEARLKEQNVKALPITYKEALKQLIQQLEDNEKLLSEVDRYERFICEKTELLTKKELAQKLDTSPVTLGLLLGKLKIYTAKTRALSVSFLNKFPNIKMFNETYVSYVDKFSGETKKYTDWQWTFLGAKSLVEYLDSLCYITYTENSGFKLKKA